jgi:tetratricopeptide (TPR) repeat protein
MALDGNRVFILAIGFSFPPTFHLELRSRAMPESESPRGEGKVRNAIIARLRKPWFLTVCLGLLLFAAALAYYLRPAPVAPPKTLDASDEDITQVLTVVNPGYVGIEVCAECHKPRAGVVKSSRHYLACRAASEGVTSPGFAPGRGLLTTRVADLHFEMTRSGNDFFATRVQTAGGEQRVPYQVGLVYGSAGKHDEMYFAWQDDRLFHLPVAWLYPFERWGYASHTTTARPTHASCLECHNTWVASIPGSINQYRRDDMLLGVTCERCHGPGREHVEHHRTHPDAPAHAILHPGTLSRERLMDVCAQCHSNAKNLGMAFSYRPGEPLDAFFHNAKPTYAEDDTTNQVRYLRESKCFQKSEMTCITCHDPHRLKSAQGGCASCHKPASCTDQPNLPVAVRGDCVGCHMPSRIWTHAHLYTTTDDQYVSLAPRADHHIGVYPEAKQAVLLTWLRTQSDARSRAEADKLEHQLTQYWTSEAVERKRAGRFKASIGAFREALRIAPDPTIHQQLQEVIARQSELDDLIGSLRTAERTGTAISLLEKMLEINPNSAFAHGELGTIYAGTGKRKEAIDHLQAVARCEPSDSYGVTRLAGMAYLDGRLEEAASLCARSYAINPVSPLNNHLWGLVLLKQKRWPDAEQQFRKVLRSDPTDAGSNDGLSMALRNQEQTADAIRFARRAAYWSKGQNADVLMTLAEAYLAANRRQDALKALEQALTVAERTNPRLAQTIQVRLRDLR